MNELTEKEQYIADKEQEMKENVSLLKAALVFFAICYLAHKFGWTTSKGSNPDCLIDAFGRCS
jgi:hypothetical protein